MKRVFTCHGSADPMSNGIAKVDPFSGEGGSALTIDIESIQIHWSGIGKLFLGLVSVSLCSRVCEDRMYVCF